MRGLRCVWLILLVSPLRAAEPGPWKLDELKQPPSAVEWIDETGPVRRLFYSGEPFQEKPTRVFAYCGFPDNSDGKSPGIVLIHGGGGTAFKEWVELWRRRGYVAIAMDLAGRDEDKQRLPDGGPDQSDTEKFPRQPIPITDVWTYHAVANCIRAHSLLVSLPNVDAERTAVTGISWGGYLTCIVAGLDDRFEAAVPVYGCGNLHVNSVWLDRFQSQMEPDWVRTWVKLFDPTSHVGGAKMPVLFVNGTNDFAYPLDSYQATYRNVEDRTLCVTVRMPHGHPAGWAPPEIAAFVEQHLRGGPPLPVIDREAKISDDAAAATIGFDCEPLKLAEFHWTTDAGAWQERKWSSWPVGPNGKSVRVELPTERPLTGYFSVRDERGLLVSSEHFELPAKAGRP